MSKIRAIFCDVDGVLTDGGYFYNASGLCMKKFHTRDASAAVRLKEYGIKLFVITGATDDITKERIGRMTLEAACFGVEDKLKMIETICEKYGYALDEVAVVGDDWMDLPAMQAVGLSFCPADAAIPVFNAADIACSCKGGEGVLCEVIDEVLMQQKPTRASNLRIVEGG